MIWKIIFCAAVSWLLDFSSNCSEVIPPFFVFAEARLQKHSLRTAQNLLQEEVARAEEHSEVKLSSFPLVLAESLTRSFITLAAQHGSQKAALSTNQQSSPPTSAQSDLQRQEASTCSQQYTNISLCRNLSTYCSCVLSILLSDFTLLRFL